MDGFRTVHDSIIQFQKCHEPTLHQILPNLQFSISELERIESGEAIIGDSGTTYKPSLYTRKFSARVRAELKSIHVHDLWLVACFLFPFLRDMGFWKDPMEKEQFKMRAEALTRTMCSEISSDDYSNECTIGVGTHPIEHVQAERPAKRRKFSLITEISAPICQLKNTDEISRYKSTDLNHFALDQQSFLSNPHSVLHFWYARKSTYPNLYKIAMRVYSTLASSSASERVFSIMKELVAPYRVNLSSDTTSKIIVGRSLLKCKFKEFVQTPVSKNLQLMSPCRVFALNEFNML